MIVNSNFKNNKIVCIYHSIDFDGVCSAEIVRKYFSDYDNIKEIGNIDLKFIGLNYDDKMPYDQLEDTVIICCDFTPINFKDIIKKSKYTIWIDHHISAIKAMGDYSVENFEKAVSTEYSACKGVWKYFYPITKVPETVELLSKFDSFMFTEDEKANVMKFQYGMKSLGNETGINGNAWKDVFNSTLEFIDSLLIRGDVILTYHNEYYDIQVANKCARTAKLNVPELDKTFNVVFINSSCAFSEAFSSVYNKEIHDIMMVGYINKDSKWVYSFYCPSDKNIDVSLIAKAFGGGGHKGAAGCLVDKQLI